MSPKEQSKNLARNQSHGRFLMKLAVLGLSFARLFRLAHD